MTFDKFIIWLMAIGILLGAGDRLLKNKFGLGQKFEEGLNAMGPLALSMVGIVSLSPVISNILGPIIRANSRIYVRLYYSIFNSSCIRTNR